MSRIVRFLAQNIFEPRLDTIGRIFFNTQLLGNCVCSFESYTINFVSQSIWILLHKLNRVISVSFVDFSGVRGTDIVGLEENHHIFDFTLRFPSFFYHGNTCRSNSLNFTQLIWTLFNDIQRLQSKLIDNSVGHNWTDTSNHSRTEIFA